MYARTCASVLSAFWYMVQMSATCMHCGLPSLSGPACDRSWPTADTAVLTELFVFSNARFSSCLAPEPLSGGGNASSWGEEGRGGPV